MYFAFQNGDSVDSLSKAEHVIVSAVPFDKAIDEVYVTGLADSGSALRAASDLLYHGLYDTPVTTKGFHAYASKLKPGVTNPKASLIDLFGIQTRRIGVVHTLYEGTLVRPAVRDIACFGWVQVDMFNGEPAQSNFIDLRTEEEIKAKLTPSDDLRGMKHGYADLLLKGYVLKIRVLFKGKASNWRDDYAATLINQWSMEDRAAALELRNKKIAARSDHVNYVRPLALAALQTEEAAQNGTPEPTPEPDPETGELVLNVRVFGFKKKTVNMYSLPTGSYSIAAGRHIIESDPYVWNPDEPKDVANWGKIQSKGFLVVLDA